VRLARARLGEGSALTTPVYSSLLNLAEAMPSVDTPSTTSATCTAPGRGRGIRRLPAAVELAKQRYRDLLRAEPQDWDARYNLERALRSAPEEQEASAEETNQPVERRNVSLRGMKAGDLP
jgi:hypothetical protein